MIRVSKTRCFSAAPLFGSLIHVGTDHFISGRLTNSINSLRYGATLRISLIKRLLNPCWNGYRQSALTVHIRPCRVTEYKAYIVQRLDHGPEYTVGIKFYLS